MGNIWKIILLLLLLFIIMAASGCEGIYFIPGASYGYYIWEEEGDIHVFWSVDKKDSSFSGTISTDGRIEEFKSSDWEEDDMARTGDGQISYDCTLGPDDYSDGIILKIEDYDHIEFDLMVNGGYDLSRVHVGAFLENPRTSPFRIDRDYFDGLDGKPWYRKHPFSGFFYRLFSNKYFTFPYVFILGVILIEILRITAFPGKRRKKLYTGMSYAILVLLVIILYFILRFFVL
jgi:hypothetical protein